MNAEASPELTTLEQLAVVALRNGVATPYHYTSSTGFGSICNLVVTQNDGAAIVLLSERSDNAGISVTNFYEQLATLIREQHLPHVAPEAIAWLEHYPADAAFGETLDRVAVRWNSELGRYEEPRWQRVRGSRAPPDNPS
ncbi:hypothetical protein [Xanthomonas phaseoli]|uniref:hypothetical protein n=1 Tax=Xanthomonas phaseoli TaxID=1985254 RepID=UPI0002D8DEC7|nr:hypothetical protein [Xanthomonas phaseoli]